MLGLAITAAVTLAAAAPTTTTVLQRGVGLDCSKGYAKMSEELATHPTAVPQGFPEAYPYRVYLDAGGRTIYSLTKPNQPAHPAFIRQDVAPAQGGVSIRTPPAAMATGSRSTG